jgi:protein-S-isoprenylcysteine O-methyltransferase Ste14
MPASDYADVAIKPPILFLGALAVGCLLSLVLPVGPRLASPNGLALGVGVTFVAIGLALAILSIRRFRVAGTSVVPGEPSTALVVEGPYRFTRNPIYIGFVLLYFGLAIILTSLWVLALLVPVAIVLQRGVVEREEIYLERQFGDAYRKYQARVPRWL